MHSCQSYHRLAQPVRVPLPWPLLILCLRPSIALASPHNVLEIVISLGTLYEYVETIHMVMVFLTPSLFQLQNQYILNSMKLKLNQIVYFQDQESIPQADGTSRNIYGKETNCSFHVLKDSPEKVDQQDEDIPFAYSRITCKIRFK